MSQHAFLHPLRIEDYLAGEEISDIRHEFVAGQVFAMVGSTRAHNRVAGNIFAFLHRHLRGTPCEVHMSDIKVRVEAADAFYYPDVVVSCEPFDPKSVFLNEPTLVVEVLSPSTENVDRREKRLNYQKLPSLKEYMLVAPDETRVEVYRRAGENLWELDVYGPEDELVALASVEARLPLAEIYGEG
ncbi:MAG: Uma2 family endonuclease [Methylothermaceae bacterium]|nr:Uma2 family endonuclease [Methylothermaceae bacterium]